MDPLEPKEEDVEQQASAWLFEREDGFAPGREEAFIAWKRADSRHAAAVARVARTMSWLDEMQPMEKTTRMEVAGVNSRSLKPIPSRRFVRFAIPLGLAAALVFSIVRWRTLPTENIVERGEQLTAQTQECVALNDGSIVDLNIGTRMAVEFSPEQRRITLGGGEAHFQVTPDSRRPFVVYAAGVSVRAVGTAFTVRIEDGAVDILVTEGKVEVEREGTKSAESGRPDSFLQAGDRARVLRDRAEPKIKIENVPPEIVRAELAWQNRMKVFRDVPLREIVAQLNRRNVTQLVLASPELGEQTFGGMMALDQIETFVSVLIEEGEISAERQGLTTILLRRAH
jgi:transmembrane sensor